MTHLLQLPALDQIETSTEDILAIKRLDLVPVLHDQSRLNSYADHIVQAQAVLLTGVDPQLNQQLSEVIARIIQLLNQSRQTFRKRQYNRLQKWLGIDIEFNAGQLQHLKELDRFIAEADQLCQRIQIEIQKSQARFQQVQGWREQMARYIRAAREFLHEFPAFARQHQAVPDHFAERLSKKIQTLQTLQASNDIALQQMRLTQQLSFSLIDRFKEAQQVLIPAWRYYLQQSTQDQSYTQLEQFDQSREQLIQTLQKTLKNKV